MRVHTAALTVLLSWGSCRSHEAFLFSCALADATRRQRIGHVMTMVLFREARTALEAYRVRCGGYPASLEAISDPPAGAAVSCARSGDYARSIEAPNQNAETGTWRLEQFDQLVSTGVHRGYRIKYEAVGPNGDGVFQSYRLSADPLERDKTGFFSFLLTNDGRVHANFSGPATESDDVWDPR